MCSTVWPPFDLGLRVTPQGAFSSLWVALRGDNTRKLYSPDVRFTITLDIVRGTRPESSKSAQGILVVVGDGARWRAAADSHNG